MAGLEDEVVYEAVELSGAVFSEGRDVFDSQYDGELDAYLLVEDVRNRIEVATMDSGEMVYPEDLPGFEELGGEEVVRQFYGLEGGRDVDLPGILYEEGLVEETREGVFYGENALPYLLVVEEAERVLESSQELGGEVEESLEQYSVEAVDEDSEEELESEPVEAGVGDDGGDKEVDDEVGEDVDKVDELSRIWDDVAGSES